jgi:PAS domain-containing protein
MPIATYLWLVGPFVLLCFVLVHAMRRAARRRDHLEAARFRGRTSEAGLASAMTDALTRMRGQELGHQARYEALDGFLHQVVESLPHGLFVLGRDGNLRVANGEALRWLGLRESVEGQVLWTLDGTEPLRAVAQACLRADARHDASIVGPGAPGAAVPVIAVPLRAADGDVDGVLYLVHVERVS